MGNHDVKEHIHLMYKHMRSLVKILIVNPEGSFDCSSTPSCVYHPVSNPEGIPPWKIFSFYFWVGGNNPLGAQWTVSPEPYSQNADPTFYLGYSVEQICHRQPFVPQSQRSHQMYILGKWLQFFSSKNCKGWSPDFYDAATEVTGISFVVGASPRPSNLTTSFADPADQGTLPKSITNYGILSQ